MTAMGRVLPDRRRPAIDCIWSVAGARFDKMLARKPPFAAICHTSASVSAFRLERSLKF